MDADAQTYVVHFTSLPPEALVASAVGFRRLERLAFLLLYSLVGVVVFAAVMSCVMAPILRRVLHAFHTDVAE